MCIMQHRLAQPSVSSRRGKLAQSLSLPPCNFEVRSRFGLREETETPCRQALPGTLSVLGLGGAKGGWLSELGWQSAAQPGACQRRAEVLGRKPQPRDFVLSALSFLFQLASAGHGGEAQLMFSSLRSLTSAGAEMFGERAFSLTLVLLSGQHWMFGNPESIKRGENPQVHQKALVREAALPTCLLLQPERTLLET